MMRALLLRCARLALVAHAVAQDTTVSSSSEDLTSILSVLQTALPSSVVQEALTNSAAASSEIAAEFAAGATPSWFTALPPDIQTYLVPGVTPASSTPTTTSSSSSSEDIISVLSVLQTALPSSIIQEALTNSGGVSSIIESAFHAAQTPTWFTALPSDIKTYLAPDYSANTTAPAPTIIVLPSGLGTTSSGTAAASTVAVGGTSPASSASQEMGASSSSSSAGAPEQTQATAVGIAVMFGLAGILAA